MYGTQTGYARLVPAAFDSWTSLFDDLGKSRFVQTGCLSIGRTDTSWAERSISMLRESGIEYQILNLSQARRRYPWLRFQPADSMVYTPEGGILLADEILEDLTSHLVKNGAVLIPDCHISTFQGTDVISEDGRIFESDHAVIALGAWHPEYFSSPIRSSRQIIGRIHTPPSNLCIESQCPMVLDIDTDRGFYFVPGSSSFPAKFGDHHKHSYQSPDSDRTVSQDEQEEIARLADYRFMESDQIAIDDYGVCYYSMAPNDSVLLEHQSGSLSISGGSGHSFKWGPLFGRLIAEVILGSREYDVVRDVIAGRHGM